MKYELIKEYPTSPKLGYKTEDFNTDFHSYYNKFPEFWKLVVEKEYEILLLGFTVSGNNGGDRELRSDGKYHLITNGNYTNPIDGSKCINNPYYYIKSVKRLSDGEVFTIGDRCHLNNSNGYQCPITKFEITFNNHGLEKYRNRETLKVFLNTNNGDANWGPFELDIIVKSKQPLFTTEDGVDIYDRDERVYLISDKFEANEYFFKYVNQLAKIFKNKQKAINYIIQNKPCLSLKEIFEEYSGSSYMKEKLTRLVEKKTKL